MKLLISLKKCVQLNWLRFSATVVSLIVFSLVYNCCEHKSLKMKSAIVLQVFCFAISSFLVIFQKCLQHKFISEFY